MDRVLVLKLGGSLITDKTTPYSLRDGTIKAVSKEIKECLDRKLVDQLVIVHGVGSYGHPPVIEHKLYKGFIDPRQLMPISRTQSKVNELREVLCSKLQDAGIPVNLFHTSSIASARIFDVSVAVSSTPRQNEPKKKHQLKYQQYSLYTY